MTKSVNNRGFWFRFWLLDLRRSVGSYLSRYSEINNARIYISTPGPRNPKPKIQNRVRMAKKIGSIFMLPSKVFDEEIIFDEGYRRAAAFDTAVRSAYCPESVVSALITPSVAIAKRRVPVCVTPEMVVGRADI